MNAEILAVGTELLMGQIANTNAQYISKRLAEIGVNVYFHSVVGDNPSRLRDCLQIALQRSDVVIMTGGLGPTQDDLTKETVAEAFGKPLLLHQESLQKIEAFFAGRKRPMVDSNRKQAYFPQDSIILENHNGTAPGCIIEDKNKLVAMLPGPPSEMRPMLDERVIPYLQKKSPYKLVSKHLRIFSIGESDMEHMLMDLIEAQTNPTIAPYAKEGEVTLRVTARCTEEAQGYAMLAPVVQEIKHRLGAAVYSEEDYTLPEVAAALLMQSGKKLSMAESCTGGMASSQLTDIPGISEAFDRGVVTYSNQAKMEMLGVKQGTLDRVGAVSMETAVEMAEGIRRVSGTDIGISITGIAGPGGGTLEKPVGLVYIALASSEGTVWKRLQLWGNRERVRSVTCLHVFDMLRRHLLGLEQPNA